MLQQRMLLSTNSRVICYCGNAKIGCLINSKFAMCKVPCVVSSVCCWCHLKIHQAKQNRTNTKTMLPSNSCFDRFPSRHNTQESQASPRTHLRLTCRLQLRPSNLVTLIHRCVQLCLQVFMLWGCFEHTCCCHYFLHTNNRERILEHEHLLWLRIALRLQLRPPKFCQWHLGLRFCGCSHIGILD